MDNSGGTVAIDGTIAPMERPELLENAAARSASSLPVMARAPAADSRSWRIRIGSLLVPLAHAAGQNVVTVLGLRFLTDSVAISAATAGAIFAMTKVYDAVTDPAVGLWSDRASTRWGRRLPFLFAGGFVMPLGLALLFGAPDTGSIIMAQVLVVIALLIHATGYTLLTIPGFAMVVEASSDHAERTRLMSWRVYGTAIGTLLGTTLPAWLLASLGSGRAGHFQMALAVGVIVLLATLLAVHLLKDAPRTQATGEGKGWAGLLSQGQMAWRNVPFRRLAIAHIFLLFGTAIGSASLAYFSRYALAAGDEVLGTYFMVATIAMVASMPLWVRLSRGFGKKACYIAAMAAFGLIHLSWLWASPGEALWLVVIRAGISGTAGGGMILCAYALLSDAVRFDYVQNGLRREGSFAGLTALLDKLSSALALWAMGLFLSWMGYVASAQGAGMAQSATAIDAVRFCTALFPALAMGAAIIVMLGYKLDPDKLAMEEATR